MKPFAIVVAMDQNRGIGRNRGLPWHIPQDLQHFKKVTTACHDPAKRNAVIMGRKTWDSLPEAFKPLPGRLNIVVSRQPHLALPQGVGKASGLEDAFALIKESEEGPSVEKFFVIGGAELFQAALLNPYCHKLYVTHILKSYGSDTFFPPIPTKFQESARSVLVVQSEVSFYFAEYTTGTSV